MSEERPSGEVEPTKASELFEELLDRAEELSRYVEGGRPGIKPTEAAEIIRDAVRELVKETGTEGFVYHSDSDGLASAIANGEEPEDVPELLSNRWHAQREYEDEEVATVDFVTPRHPGVDHKRPSPDVQREDHVIVPMTSMCAGFGKLGQALSWITSDVSGRATPYDVVAVAEFMETTRGTFEDVLRDLKAGRPWAIDELSMEILDRFNPEELPAPKFKMLELPGGARVAVADYGSDEAVALAPMSACDIVLGDKYAWIGNPVVLTEELRVTVERIHLRKVVEDRLRRAKKLPTMTLPPAGIGMFP